MFFPALIAIASVLSLSKISVTSAPVVRPGSIRSCAVPDKRSFQTVRDVVPQACTLPFGGGVCTPLNGTSCTNTPGIQSLILNLDADCAAFPLPDCEVGQGALEQFSDDSQHLEGKGIQSVQCFENVGTVNGATAGSPEDIAQEAADADEAEGIVRIPPPNCVEGPVQVSPEQQAEADADGIVLSGPITCTFD
ncbi:hypothetical protein DFH09DRAFT_1080857 [Mycena vulgaris]|nr:hypothetical protein DFH09DRAFT_1080857 [Mycena vulgaris]